MFPGPVNSRRRRRLEVMSPLLHFGAETRQHFVAELVGPVFSEFHAFLHDLRLLGYELAAERRFVEGKRILELLLGETRGVEFSNLVEKLSASGRIFRSQPCGNLIEVLPDHWVDLQERELYLLDDVG